MPEARKDARKQYSKTRDEFEKLGTQDRTAFVLEATFATLGQAIEDTGRQVAEVFERVANYDFGARPEAAAPGAEPTPNPAKPPSAKKRAPEKPKATDEDG